VTKRHLNHSPTTSRQIGAPVVSFSASCHAPMDRTYTVGNSSSYNTPCVGVDVMECTGHRRAGREQRKPYPSAGGSPSASVLLPNFDYHADQLPVVYRVRTAHRTLEGCPSLSVGRIRSQRGIEGSRGVTPMAGREGPDFHGIRDALSRAHQRA